ncbi:MAG: gliding motility-associated C-terminal domain-containing protein [Flavobacteriaceae bacterium]|nr:gliding motility-associated C-terminal domain-containing protein [Flavobacteriaceae bacterium]
MRKPALIFFFIAFFGTFSGSAQIQKSFSKRYSSYVNGDYTTIANNVLSKHKSNNYHETAGNHYVETVFVDIDNDASTFNSSSANLVNPVPGTQCLTIKKAFLYWAAADYEDDNEPNWNYQQVKLKLPGSNSYLNINGETIYRGRDVHFENDPYVVFKDITAIIQGMNNPFGTYTVANVKAKTGSLRGHSPNGGNTGTSGGWQLVFVYESPYLQGKNITIFDGYAHVTKYINNFDVEFSNFLSIPYGQVRAKIMYGALEGDQDIDGDALLIQRRNSNNYNALRTPNGDSNNFFSSSVTHYDQHFTNRVPASTNTLGYDVGIFDLENPNNSIIDNNQSRTRIRMTSDQESYGLYMLGMSIEEWSPGLRELDLSFDTSQTSYAPGELMEFELEVKNTGNDDMKDLQFQTTMPETVDFVGLKNLPNWIQSNYNNSTRQLTITVDDGHANVGMPSFTIAFEVRIKDACYFLEGVCADSFALQTSASFRGTFNPDLQTATSSGTYNNCKVGNNDPTVVSIAAPAALSWATAPNNLDRIVYVNDATANAAAMALQPSATACNPNIQLLDSVFLANANCANIGSITRTWQFTDGCGRTSEVYTQTITIIDTDMDLDGIYDSCDDDIDGDGCLNTTEPATQADASRIHPSCDTDSDGIHPIVDLDDDNDGILDTNETLAAYNGTIDYTFNNNNNAINNAPNWLVQSTAAVQVASGLNATNTNGVLEINGANSDNLPQARLNNHYVQYSFTTAATITDARLSALSSALQNGGYANYSVGVYLSTNNFSTEALVVKDFQQVGSNTFNYLSNHFGYLQANTTYSIRIYIYKVEGGNTIALDNLSIAIRGLQARNTDNTDLPDHLDTDSDNDGCADTLEAGHTDADVDGQLGAAPIQVNQNGLVQNQGGYTGTNIYVTQAIVPLVWQNQPSNQLVSLGANLSFDAQVTGGDIVYQWQVSNDGVQWNNLTNTAPYANVNTASLQINSASANLHLLRYRLQTTAADNACAPISYSEAAQLFVKPQINIVPASVEEGQTLVFDIQLSHATGQVLNFSPSYTHIETNASDFNPTTSLSIPATATTATLDVPTNDDVLIEATETFRVALNNLNTVDLQQGNAIGTITDNDNLNTAGIAFQTENITVNEATGTLSVNVVLNADVQDAFNINYTTQNGTAEAGSDYTATSGILTFDNNNKTQSITIPITDDNWIEATENFTINLSKDNAVLVNILTPTASVSILDNDNSNAVGLRFNPESVSVNEDAGVASFTVELIADVQDAFTINYTTQNGTALAGSDYTATSGSLNFDNNNKTQNISIPITDDSLIEATENFRVLLSKDNTVLVNILTAEAVATIADNDNIAGAGISFENTNINVTEDGVNAVFTLQLNADVQDAFTISYATQNGTAEAGSDYTATSGMLTFDNNNKTQTVSVPITDDNWIEKAENFFLDLSKDNAVLVNLLDNQAIATIIDNDNLPATGVSFQTTNLTVNEAAGSISFEVVLNADVQDAFAIQYTTQNETAEAGSDYTATSGTLNFSNSQKTQTITIPITDDSLVEATENFRVELSKTNAVLVNILTPTATATILDNDNTNDVGISFDATNTTVNEDAGFIRFTVRLNADVQSPFGISYTTQNDTAEAGNDYTATTGVLNFSNSNKVQEIEIPIIDDTSIEATEQFRVLLSKDNSVLVNIITPEAIASITDNDNLPSVGIAFENTSIDIIEDGSNALFTLVLNGDVQDPFQISYTTQNGTALAGSDYSATSGTLSFDNNNKTQSIRVPITDDSLIESTENFLLNLSKDANVLVNLLDTQATANIIDNDNLAEVGVAFETSNIIINEDAGTVSVNVTLNADVQDAFSINYTTQNGTAEAGSDYTETTGVLNFSNNNKVQTITIPITDDNWIEATENFSIVLSKENEVLVNILTPTASIEIIDNDNLAEVGIAFETTNITINEDAGTLTLNVALNADVQDAFTINYTTQNGTAAAGSDYTTTTGTLTFDNNNKIQPIEIPILEDTFIEATEDFSVLLSKDAGVLVNILTESATVSINDNDNLSTAGILIEDQSISIVEDGIHAVFSLRLNADVQDAFDISYSTQNGTAEAGSDYTVTTGTLSFDNTNKVQSISVPVTDDDLIESTENFFLNLSKEASVLVNLIHTQATATILDNDNVPTAGIEIVEDALTVNESAGTASIRVRLNANVQDAFDISYSTQNGTAEAGSDYDNLSGTLSFDNNNKEQTITIPIIDDNWIEATENFQLVLSKDNTVLVNLLEDTATISIEDNDNNAGTGIRFNNTSITVNEADATATLEIQLLGLVQDPVIVSYATADDTAIAGTDFTATTATVQLDNTNNSVFINIPILEDNLIEVTEQFFVNLSTSSTLLQVLSPQATVSIVDNDNLEDVGIQFQTTDITIDEAGQSVSVLVQLTAAVQDPFSIAYETIAGTATADTDYTSATGTLNFSNTVTEQTIVVPILDDSLIENVENFVVRLTKNAAVIPNILTPEATISIIDNDNTVDVGVTFQATDFTVNEEAGEIEILVSLTAQVQDAFEIAYETFDTSALAGSDYTATSGNLFFDNNTNSQTIRIPILEDSYIENIEQFGIRLSKDAAVLVNILTPEATIHIVDNDNLDGVGVLFEQEDVTINEGDGNLRFEVRLNADIQDAFLINYQTQNNTAQAPGDYSSQTGTILFSNDQKVQFIDIAIEDDNLIEATENFRVLLTKDANVLVNILTPQATGIIEDNDNLANVGVSFENTMAYVDEDAGEIELVVNLNATVQNPFSIQYTTQNGSATAGQDYNGRSGSLNFSNTQTSQSIFIPIIDDNWIETLEQLEVVLRKEEEVLINILTPIATVNIVDNDNLPTVGVYFDPNSVEVNEDAGTARLEVVFNGEVQDPFSIQYATQNETAEAGTDYTATTGTLNFDNNQKTQIIEIPILEDNWIEYTESFRIVLSKEESVLVNILPPDGFISIIDNDNREDLGISFNPNTIEVNEDAGTATLEIVLNGEVQDDFEIAYQTTNDTATDFNDYNAVNGYLSFGLNQKTQSITIPILDDTVIEATEQFFVNLSKSEGVLVNILEPQAIVKILDNDNNENVGISLDQTNITINEGAGTAIFTVGLNAQVQDPFRIAYTTQNQTAEAGTDYTLSSGTIEFSNTVTSQQIEIPIIDDTWIEATESFTLLLSKETNVLVNILTPEATINIEDNDNISGAGIRIDALDITVNENEAFANFSISLNADVQDAFRIQYTTNQISASPGSDYTTTSWELEFDNTNKNQVIAVPILDDDVVEPVEKFGLQLSKDPAVLVNILNEQAQATIFDDDQDGGVGVRFLATNKTVYEDAQTISFDVQLTGNVQGGFRLDYNTNEGTAIPDKDYVPTTGTLYFDGTQGETKTIVIPIYDDFIEENTETFTILLSNLSTNLINITTEVATITIIDNDDYSILPQDMEVSCDAIPAVANIPDNSNCNLNILFQETIAGRDDTCPSEYNIIRTWTITDCVFNVKQHVQNISVIDKKAPSFVEELPEDTTASCDAIPAAITLTAIDNCDTDIQVQLEETTEYTIDNCTTNYRIIRTYTATDCAQNSVSHTQTILVLDTEAPVWNENSLPANLEVSCDAIPEVVNPTATDNCAPEVAITFEEQINYKNSACTANYTLTRIWTATDCAGNSSSHSQTIMVVDDNAPYFVGSLPTDLELQCDANIPEPQIEVADACDDQVTVAYTESIQNENECGTEYSILRTWVATDCSGNSISHQQTISISDIVAPTFVENLPQNATVSCNDIPPSPTLSATDNCDNNPVVTFSEEISNDANCEQGYHIIRTWTATDCAGNESVHTQVLTIPATGPIVASDYTKEITINCGEEIPEKPELTFSGGCEDFQVVFEEEALYPNDSDDFSIRRRWTVTDACNNVAVFEQFIFIKQLETIFLTLDICIEEEAVDLKTLLPEGYALIGGTYENTQGNAVMDGDIFRPADHALGEYTILLQEIDNLGCIYMVEYSIRVHDECVVLPCGQSDISVNSALTPNGDGKNDYLVIQDAGCDYTYDILVFNRWGAEIYRNSNYQNDWDGYAPNSAFGGAGTLPSGTYYYIIKIPNSGLQPINGYFYLGTDQ